MSESTPAARVDALLAHLSPQQLAEKVVRLEDLVEGLGCPIGREIVTAPMGRRADKPDTSKHRALNMLIQQGAAAEAAQAIQDSVPPPSEQPTTDIPLESNALCRAVILRNSAKCAACGKEVESTAPNHFESCGCGLLCVSGGRKFLRRSGPPHTFEDTSEIAYERKGPGD